MFQNDKNNSVRPVCCVRRMVTFKEQGLNAVMQVLFAVKASLSRVVYATIVRVPYCVKPQGTGYILHPPHPHLPPPTPTDTNPPSFPLAWKIPHEPLLWCKSQVGEMWARLMHRHCAVKSLLTLPTGDSRKRHRARAGEEEESDKEGKGAKEREMRGDMSISGSHFWLSVLFWLTVLSLSPIWWTELSGLHSSIPTLSLRFGMFNLFSPSLLWADTENNLFLLVLKKKKKACLIQPLDLTAIIPLRPNLFSYSSLVTF